MKIAFLAKSHFESSIRLVKHLAEQTALEFMFIVAGDSHRESCFDFDLRKLPLGYIDDQSTIRRLTGKKYEEYLLNCTKVSMYRLESWSIMSGRNLRLALGLARKLRSGGFDLLHFNGTVGMLQPLYFFLTPEIPKVQTIHDSTPHSGEWNIRKIILKSFLVRRSDLIILCSDYCRKDLERAFDLSKKSIAVIPFGPLPMGQVGSFSEQDARILFWGRISRYKGLEYLLQAFPRVKEKVPEAELFIAGAGKFHFPTEDYLSHGVKIINRYIPDEELHELVEKSAIVVVPYTDATQSGVVMVAFTHGKPVVASEVGGIPEMVRHEETGLLVPPKDPEALSNAIKKLLEDAELRNKMKSNIASMLSCEFSWDSQAKRLLRYYRELIRK